MSAFVLHQGLPAPTRAVDELDLDALIADRDRPPAPAEACTEIGAEPDADPSAWALRDFLLVVASAVLCTVFITNFGAALLRVF